MMIDVSCPKCSRRFGWSGEMVNSPACPKCGHRPPQSELEAADARMEADRKRRETDPASAAGSVLRQQRVDAGLTLRQAAKILGMVPSDLSDLEAGRKSPCPQELAAKMIEVYGLEVDQ